MKVTRKVDTIIIEMDIHDASKLLTVIDSCADDSRSARVGGTLFGRLGLKLWDAGASHPAYSPNPLFRVEADSIDDEPILVLKDAR